MTRARMVVTAAAMILASTATTLADSRIEFKATEGQGASFQTILIAQGKIRQDSDKNTSTILDPGAGSITVLDHSKKTFTRLTRADIDQLSKTIEDLLKQMEQTMANMPPEMRERMKGMMSGGATGALEMVDTGQRGTVAGRPCRVFQTKIMGRVASESCMGEASAIELPAADRATVAAATAFAKELGEKLAKGPLGNIGNSMPMRGGLMPLRTTTIAADGTRSTSEFTGVTNAAIPAESFAVPAGYTERKIELPGRGRGGF